ncbi:MAG: hypothetical protein NTX45_14720 [Proteobacteria bacterium]|nr:hypothetical protein [Pseudomonadota bacterium]
MYTIELDTQTESKLAQIARREGKEPVVWIKEKLVNMIQNRGFPTELSGGTESLEALNKRIGIAKGLFDVPDSIDSDNDVVASLFNTDLQ